MTSGFHDVLAFAWRHWRRHPIMLATLAVTLTDATLAEIAIPTVVGQMIDALGAGDPTLALHSLLAMVGLSLIFHVFHKGGDYVWCGLAVRVMRRIGADAFARVQRHGAQWHADTFAGKTVRNITRGIWAFDDFGDAFYLQLLPSAAVVLGVTVVMVAHWPVMGALFLLGTTLYAAVSITMAAVHVSPRRRLAVAADSRLGGALADSITCNAVVKAVAAERREDRRLAGILDHWHRLMLRAWDAWIDTAVARARP